MNTCPLDSVMTRLPGKTKETARVVIVGAGPAGVAAATRLLEQGFKNVRILEAEDRVGGRIKTIPYADNVVDLGAQWCHGEEGNVVYQTVKDLNMVSNTGEFLENFRFLRSNKETMSPAMVATLRTIAEKSLPDGSEPYEGSTGDYLTKMYWQEVAKLPDVDQTTAAELLESFKKGECSVEGCDHLFELSGRTHLEFEDSKGDRLIHWREKGFKTFLKHLMQAKEDPPNDLGVLNGRVQLNTSVVGINWKGSDVLTVRTWSGDMMYADHVICTMSLGVLKDRHPTIFSPALPDAKLRAIKGLKLGTVDKFYLEFEEQPLPQAWMGINFLWLDEDLRELRGTERFWLEGVVGFHKVMKQPRLLEGWIIGEGARHMETLMDSQVLDGLLWLFRKFVSFDIPYPAHFLRTQWYSNPNFRGSYSFRTTYADELQTGPWDLADPLVDMCGKPRLQFAGEATSKNHYSTVHGATESGWREADRLNEYYNRPNTLDY